jgi:hypothetical protein
MCSGSCQGLTGNLDLRPWDVSMIYQIIQPTLLEPRTSNFLTKISSTITYIIIPHTDPTIHKSAVAVDRTPPSAPLHEPRRHENDISKATATLWQPGQLTN